MRRTRLPIVALLLALPGASGAWAGEAALPHRYSTSSLDGGLVQIQNPVDGRAWSVWAYRSGAEYDIAVSVRQGGLWSEPSFLGQADSKSQIQPALTVDPSGNLYLAFALREIGQIMLSTLRVGSDVWSAPVSIVGEPGRHFAPALRIVGGMLVVAYRSGAYVGITVVPLLGQVSRPEGIQDGPDGFPLPGSSSDDLGPD